MARRARWVSVSAGVFAVVLSTAIALIVLRSIAEPLRHLTAGTRALSEGKFFYRLDTSRHDEFAQLAKDFNAMTVRLDELTAMKKGFVSHVSHELKAPLASIQETVHLLLEGIAGPLSDKQRRLLELSFQSGKRLSTMLANLLDLSRHEAGVMEYDQSPQDLAAIVRGAVNQFTDPAAQKEIAVAAELPSDPVVVECDPDRMIQVLGNLLDNAIKFSPRGGTVVAELRRVDAVPEGLPASQGARVGAPGLPGEFALVSVSDRGPGVVETRRQIIFENLRQESFGRTPGARKLAGQGVGLGLAISKIIVDAHGGALWVEDNPGGGSVFRVLLRSAQLKPETVAARVDASDAPAASAGEAP
jgi:signal transduction histidine kinase